MFDAGTIRSKVAEVFVQYGHSVLLFAISVFSVKKHKKMLFGTFGIHIAKGCMTEEEKLKILERRDSLR